MIDRCSPACLCALLRPASHVISRQAKMPQSLKVCKCTRPLSCLPPMPGLKREALLVLGGSSRRLRELPDLQLTSRRKVACPPKGFSPKGHSAK